MKWLHSAWDPANDLGFGILYSDATFMEIMSYAPYGRQCHMKQLSESQILETQYFANSTWETSDKGQLEDRPIRSISWSLCRFHSFKVQNLAWSFRVIMCMRRWLNNYIAWHPPSGLGFRVLYSETTMFLQIIITNAPYGRWYHLPRLATLLRHTAPWGPHCGRRVWADSNSRTHAIPQRSWPPQLAVVSPASCCSHVLELTASEAPLLLLLLPELQQ
jgi:hypothetical protein